MERKQFRRFVSIDCDEFNGSKELNDRSNSNVSKRCLSKLVGGHRLVKNCALFLRFLGHIMQLDLEMTSETRRFRFAKWIQIYDSSIWRWRNRSRLLHLIPLLYLYSILHILAVIYYQYRHDWKIKRLERIESTSMRETFPREGNDTTWARVQVELEDLVAEIRTTSETLAWLGAPHIKATFAAECLYLSQVFISVAFPQSYIYYLLVQPFNFQVVRAILSRQQEQENINRMLREVVNKYMVSSYNFVCFARRMRRSTVIGRTSIRFNDQQMSEILSGCNERIAVQDHNQIVDQIRSIASRGLLQPLNQNPKQILSNSLVIALTSIVLITNCLFYDIIILGSAIYFAAKTEDGWIRPMDLIVIIDLAFIIFLTNTTSVFFPSLSLVNCLDQSVYANKIRAKIEHCIRMNNARFFDLSKLQRKQSRYEKRSLEHVKTVESLKGQMNFELLLTLIHFKLFIWQFKHYSRSFSLIIFWAVVLTFTFPILGRLHVPYISSEINQQFRLFVVILSLIVLACTNLCLVPACYTHKRCLDLYKALSSLLAHVTRLETEHSHSNGERIYNRHNVYALRKELEYPKLLLAKFATNSGGLSLRYGTMLALYFWFSLIGFSTLFEASSGNSLSASLLLDPFRVYNQLE